MRLHGKLEPIQGAEPARRPQTPSAACARCSSTRRSSPSSTPSNEVDFSYSVEGLARFRVNAFRQRGSSRSCCARSPSRSSRSTSSCSRRSITRLAEEERGIILLTGTTGSGKSTTLAAMIDHMNRTMRKHIVTIEDPIEFLHPDRQSIVNQREVGRTPRRSSARCAASCARTRT